MSQKKPMSPLKQYILLITYAVVLVMLFIQKNEIFGMIGRVLGVMRPFFVGILIAYVLNAPMRAIENKILPKLLKKAKKRNPSLERGIAVAMTMIFAVAIVTVIVSVLIPQLLDSVSIFVSNIESYVQSLEAFTNSLAERFHLDDALWTQIEAIGNGILENIVTAIQGSMPQILNTTKNVMATVANGLFNTLMSTIISVYMLYHKEKLIRQLKNVDRQFYKRDVRQVHRRPDGGGLHSGRALLHRDVDSRYSVRADDQRDHRHFQPDPDLRPVDRRDPVGVHSPDDRPDEGAVVPDLHHRAAAA